MAGHLDKQGYRVIRLDRRLWYAHQLAWTIHYGEWPALEIDHRDGDRGNNRIDNLRLASHAQNLANQGVQKHNTSGFKGVSFNKRSGKWEANIAADMKRRCLGLFETAEQAAQAYDAAAQTSHGSFARLNFPQGEL